MLAFGIKQTSTTTGTGALALSSVSGFPQFNDCFPAANARRFEYEILDSNGAPIENGVGYLSGSSTLVREKIFATYDGGVYDDTTPAAVSLAAGTKTVICGIAMATAQITAPNIDAGSTANVPRRIAYDAFLNLASASSSGFPLTADMLYLVPFYLAQAIECSGIMIRVGTGVAAKQVRLGLYELGSIGFPTRLMGETAALAAATSGVDLSGSFASNLRLSPGWYCIGMVSDGAIAIGVASSNGRTSFLGASSSNVLLPVGYRNIGYTFAALPNPPTTATNVATGISSQPVFGLLAV